MKNLLSITKVIQETKPFEDRQALENWKIRVGEEEARRISEESRARGKKLDEDFRELHETGSCQSIALANFMKDYQIMTREFNLESETLGVKGRLDTILSTEGTDHLYLIDFKTSKKTKNRKFVEDYFLQIGGYYAIIKQENLIPIYQGKIVIFIGDQFTPQIFRMNKAQLEGYAEKFLQRLEQYKSEQNHE